MNAVLKETPISDTELHKPTVALSVVQRANVALDSKATEKKLAKLAKQSTSITAVTNDDGRAECHRAAMVLRTTRTAIEKTGKAAREDAKAFSDAVIKEQRRLIAIISPEEDRLLKLRDDYDERIQREEDERKANEAARMEAINNRIDAIRKHTIGCEGKSSAEIETILNMVNAINITEDEFDEHIDSAIQAQAETKNTLTKLMLDAIEREDAEVTRKAAIDAENTRLEAMREERRKLEAQNAEMQRQIEDKQRQHASSNSIASVKEVGSSDKARVAMSPADKTVAATACDVLNDATPSAPSAEEIIMVIADCYDVTQEIAHKWLAATSFN